jgi:hypothetical protein
MVHNHCTWNSADIISHCLFVCVFSYQNKSNRPDTTSVEEDGTQAYNCVIHVLCTHSYLSAFRKNVEPSVGMSIRPILIIRSTAKNLYPPIAQFTHYVYLWHASKECRKARSNMPRSMSSHAAWMWRKRSASVSTGVSYTKVLRCPQTKKIWLIEVWCPCRPHHWTTAANPLPWVCIVQLIAHLDTGVGRGSIMHVHSVQQKSSAWNFLSPIPEVM